MPLFVQVGGRCDAGNNFGFECQGRRRNMDWTSTMQLQSKLSYSYGSGSSISLTGLAYGQQLRNWPGTNIGDPALYSGAHTWQRLGGRST